MTGSEVLGDRMSALVRAFGLLAQDRTPCGESMSVSVAHALLALDRAPALAQGALIDHLRLEKSTVSRLVDSLVRRGWVRRTTDHRDGRAIRLVLTNDGQSVADRLATARAGRFATIFERIPQAAQPQVLQALAILVDAIDEQDVDAARPEVDS